MLREKRNWRQQFKNNFRTKLRFSMFSADFRGRGGSENVQEGPYMPGERFWNRGINLKKFKTSIL